jgi:hypothetical protein
MHKATRGEWGRTEEERGETYSQVVHPDRYTGSVAKVDLKHPRRAEAWVVEIAVVHSSEQGGRL